MKIEERLQILQQIENVAALAGLRGRIDDDARHFTMSFNTEGTRSQQVYVRPCAKTPDGKDVVTLFSPARVVAKGMFSGMSKEHALELLRMNENTCFARFGLWDTDKQSMVVASSDLILESMDPVELKAHAYYVAFAADRYEAKHGSDQF